jgi:hypothetical protein
MQMGIERNTESRWKGENRKIHPYPQPGSDEERAKAGATAMFILEF